MKEELISYKTAVLAKERGFDLKESEGVYFWVGCDEDLLAIDTGELADLYSEQIYDSDEDLLAPTQSLLQKWLREEKELNIDVIYAVYPKGYWSVVCSSAKELHKSKVLPTYEQALEEGLYEALKLIN